MRSMVVSDAPWRRKGSAGDHRASLSTTRRVVPLPQMGEVRGIDGRGREANLLPCARSPL